VVKDMPDIVVIDYGMGNLRSVQRGIDAAGSPTRIITEKEGLRGADAIILPGVGAFRDAIANLAPFKQGICDAAESGVPLLGICLGLQLLFTQSTEGGSYLGLDILSGTIQPFPKGRKIPQIGWNTLMIVDAGNPLVSDVPEGSYVYFVHSYYAQVEREKEVVAMTRYGIDFPSIISRRNVFATQFHPEKSGKMGLKILKNFVDIVKR
jgi:glutamine amidotransferase